MEQTEQESPVTGAAPCFVVDLEVQAAAAAAARARATAPARRLPANPRIAPFDREAPGPL